MKNALVILSIVSLGLAVGLLIQHNQASQTIKATEESRTSFSNSWQQAKVKADKLDEAEKVAAALEAKLTERTEALTAATNELARTSANLAQTSGDLTKAQADFTAAQAEMKNQQSQIARLESQRDDLTKKMDDLTGSINNLETRITETKQKLATSEGDRSFLLKELARLQNEKATLVAQWNSLSALRSQVAKLREEAAINQRLAWMRSGIYATREQKGAEKLLVNAPLPAIGDSRLEVEVEQNGRGKVVPPSSGAKSAE